MVKKKEILLSGRLRYKCYHFSTLTVMKKNIILSAVATGSILLSATFMSCDLTAKEKTITASDIATSKGQHSYAIGTDMGKGIKSIETDLDYAIVIQGIKDQLDSTRTPLMNDSQVTAALQNFMQEMRAARMAKDSVLAAERKAKAVENLATQTAFLEKNKAEVGVITTESGLQYISLTEGSGAVAKDGDTVSVHYTGTLLDGNKFDSSIDRNQPLSITLGEGQLIPGWVEMLRLMKKGDKVKAWVPSNLAYGENGNQVILGNSLLIFEMELLDIKPKK